jgi:hypothetical protein
MSPNMRCSLYGVGGRKQSVTVTLQSPMYGHCGIHNTSDSGVEVQIASTLYLYMRVCTLSIYNTVYSHTIRKSNHAAKAILQNAKLLTMHHAVCLRAVTIALELKIERKKDR